MINISIRRHFFKNVPKNEKEVISLKYIRTASITEMAAHLGVNFFKSRARSGHSLGTHQERYSDQNILALILLGACSLNGLVDATPNKL